MSNRRALNVPRRVLSMSHDLVELKALIVCDSAVERDALKAACVGASVVIDVCEVDRLNDASSVCRLLTEGNIDVVLLDCGMMPENRRTVVDAARVCRHPPFVISIGSEADDAASASQMDGSIAKPIQVNEVRAVLNCCVRSRLPNRVLIVDDSATVRAVIRKVLQSCRYRFEVEEVSDGVAALEQAGRERFDLVLLDCHMPGVDGFDTLAKLLESRADAKVVMVTATNDLKLRERARNCGAFEVLYKPFYAKDIDNVMNRMYGLATSKTR